MAVAHRNTQTANTGSTPANSLTINLPTGTVAGDTLLAAICIDGGSGGTISTPSGWTTLSTSTETTNTKMAVLWRLADGTETSTYQWNFDTTRQAAGTISAYSGGYPFRPPQVVSTTNSSASATMTPASTNPSYSGMYLTFFGHRNTTAAATITQAAGYNERADVSTSASAFIGVEVQDITNPFPLTGSVTTTSTATQSVTFSNIVIQLPDNHGVPAGGSGIQVDQMTAGSRTTSGANLQGLRMNTNYANELLLTFVAIGKDVQTVSTVTGNSLTWVNIGRTNVQNGSVEVWRAFQSTAVAASSSFTVQANFSSSVVSAFVVTMGLSGTDITGTNGSGAIGATANANGTISAPTASITTTRNNSLVMGLANNPSANISFAAGTNQTLFRKQGDGTNSDSSGANWQSAATPMSGTNVTIDWASGAMVAWNEFILEILAAPAGSFLDLM